MQTTGATTVTFEGAPGYLRDEKGELFQLAVVNFVGQDTFYESAENRDKRYARLVRSLAVKDPEWTFGLLKWMRGPECNLRTASLVGAAEFVHARLAALKAGKIVNVTAVGDHAFTVARWNRLVIDAVLQRADEPGELLAYWTSNYGRNLPQPIKRGVADAVKRLYTERGYLRYDSNARAWRFADVIDLVHPKATDVWQGDLYQYALDVRHGRAVEIPLTLEALWARKTIGQMSADRRHHVAHLALRDGMDGNIYKRAMAGQWEWLHSTLGDTTNVKKPVDKLGQWKLVLPQLGYMALLRNLRNLAEAGISYQDVQTIQKRLADPGEVEKSRQFPFAFWTAYNANAGGFSAALDAAFMHSMRNIPDLPGRTLVLVDTSGSMQGAISGDRSTTRRVDAAAVFGVALAVRNPQAVDLYGFASGEFRHDVATGASAMGETKRFIGTVGKVGHGTDIHGAVQRQFRRGYHNRVIIISDMQTMDSHHLAHRNVPANVPIYGFNLGGYRPALMPLGPGRHEFGGLTDATFKTLPLLERGENAGWPWEA